MFVRHLFVINKLQTRFKLKLSYKTSIKTA
jgi:hypothetical protein